VTKKLVILLAIFVAALIVSQGCYTMIKHPKVNYVDHTPQHYARNCFDCHQELANVYVVPWIWKIKVEEDDDYIPTDEEKPDRRRGLQPNPWDRDWDPAGFVPIVPGGGGSGTVTKEDPNKKTKVEDPKPGQRRGLQKAEPNDNKKPDDKNDKPSTGSKTDK
jgi:hypothetical protein